MRVATPNGGLNELRDSYRAVLNLLPEVIFEADEDGGLVWLNQSGCILTGSSPPEVESFFDLLAPWDRVRAARDFASLMPEEAVEQEYALRRADGGFIPVEAKSQLIATNGRSRRVMGVMVEVGQNDREARFERSVLDCMLKATGAICHEFGQPLQLISGHADLLLMDLDDDRARRSAERIKRSVKRIDGLVKQLGNVRKLEMQSYVGDLEILDIRKSAAADPEQE